MLSKSQVRGLIDAGHIDGASPNALDHSSLDLHLSEEGYVLSKGSVKPFGDRYLTTLKRNHLVEEHAASPDGTFLLERKKTYLFRLQEKLQLKGFVDRHGGMYGQATAKSSIGRVDVLARLIVDGSRDYEGFSPDEVLKANGDMYIEITPITFNVRVKKGIALNQLRLFLGSPDDVVVKGAVLYRSVLRGVGGTPDGSLSVDLSDATICGVGGAALVAAEDNPEPISLWMLDDPEKPKPWRYWKLRSADEHERLRITQDHFYIIRSRERIVLPQGVAVYCRASDETIGEMRIHYAGFVHPFFGYREHGEQGTPLIFEVRGHNVDVSLLHGERMAKLIFYRMSEDAVPDGEQSYNDQELQLSKFFAKFPEKLTKTEDGTLVPGA